MFDCIDPSPRAVLVGAETWPSFGPRIQPHLQKMADGSGGRYLAEDILGEILSGRMHVWLALDGNEIACVLVTQIMQYPRSRALRCIGVVGHRASRWTHLMHNVELAAKTSFGCDRIEALHQAGHERLLRTPGWSTFHALSEKTL